MFTLFGLSQTLDKTVNPNHQFVIPNECMRNSKNFIIQRQCGKIVLYCVTCQTHYFPILKNAHNS